MLNQIVRKASWLHGSPLQGVAASSFSPTARNSSRRSAQMPDFERLFEKLNASQIRSDRNPDRLFTWWVIAGLAFSAAASALALSAWGL